MSVSIQIPAAPSVDEAGYVTNTDLGTAAPAGARTGWNTDSGRPTYVDVGGNWQEFVPPEEVVVIADTALGTAAPADAKTGVISSTGREAYVDLGGLWQERLAPVVEEVITITAGDLGTAAPADADLAWIGTTGRRAFVNGAGDWEEIVDTPSRWTDSVDDAPTLTEARITQIEGHNVVLPDPPTTGDFVDLRPEEGKTWETIAGTSDWTPPAGHTITVSTGLQGRAPVRIVFDGGTTWSVDFAGGADLPVKPGVDFIVQTRNVAGTTQDVRRRRFKNENDEPAGFDWYMLDGTAVTAPADAASYVVSGKFRIARAEFTPAATSLVAAWGASEVEELIVEVFDTDSNTDKYTLNVAPGGGDQWHQIN